MHQIESWVTANKLTMKYSKTDFVLFSNQTYIEETDKLCVRAQNGTIITQKKVLNIQECFLTINYHGSNTRKV